MKERFDGVTREAGRGISKPRSVQKTNSYRLSHLNHPHRISEDANTTLHLRELMTSWVHEKILTITR